MACVDVSGSMRGEKLRYLKMSLEKLIEQLSATDRLAVIAFESDVHFVLRLPS